MSDEQMSTTSSFDMIGEEEKQRDQNGDHLTDIEQDNQTELGVDELEMDNVTELKKQLEAMKAEKDELTNKLEVMKLEKMLLILPMNRWNSNDCHADLFIAKHPHLVVQRCRNNTDASPYVSVRAELMMPRHCHGIFYFEVTIVKRSEMGLLIGLAPHSLKTTANTNFKDFTDCYSYSSNGIFWGHHVDGCQYHYAGKVMPNVDGKPRFGAGDVVGCGVNLATNQIIYTKNGQRLDTAGLLVCEPDLFPFVVLPRVGDAVEANFGHRRFLYDFVKELADEGGIQKN